MLLIVRLRVEPFFVKCKEWIRSIYNVLLILLAKLFYVELGPFLSSTTSTFLSNLSNPFKQSFWTYAFPLFTSFRPFRRIRLVRKMSYDLPLTPPSSVTLETQHQFKQLSDSNIDFFTFESDHDFSLILCVEQVPTQFAVLMDPRLLELLPQVLFASIRSARTFVRSIAYELFTIYCEVGSQMFPFFHCLVANPDRQTLKYVFRSIRIQMLQKNSHFQPTRIVTEFDSELVAAIRDIFPEAIVSGCSIQMQQLIEQKILTCDLNPLYQVDDYFRQFISALVSLQFTPIFDFRWTLAFVNANFGLFKTQALANFYGKFMDALPLMRYLTDTFFAEDSMFPPKFWNYFDVHLLHRRTCPTHHLPNFFKSFDILFARLRLDADNVWDSISKQLVQPQLATESSLKLNQKFCQLFARHVRNRLESNDQTMMADYFFESHHTRISMLVWSCFTFYSLRPSHPFCKRVYLHWKHRVRTLQTQYFRWQFPAQTWRLFPVMFTFTWTIRSDATLHFSHYSVVSLHLCSFSCQNIVVI